MALKQEFEDYYDAEDAVEEMNDKKVEGRRLTVEPAGKKKRNRERSRSSHRRHRKRYIPALPQKPQLFGQSIEVGLQ
jgi:RNA recognition motif-containing protein